MLPSRMVIACSSMFLLAGLGLGGCAASSSFRNEPPSSEIGKLYARDSQVGSPCRDSLYLVLRAQPLDSLSERQLRYLLLKDQECANYQQAHEQGSNAAGVVAVGALILVVLLTVAYANAMSHYPWGW